MPNTTQVGRKAETVAAQFLERKGCIIVAQNWRTRMCEIDIIAVRANVIYFCEVKYRKTNQQGAGLDYITTKKLQQMRFATESWVHKHGWQGKYELCAVEVSGSQFTITAVVKGL